MNDITHLSATELSDQMARGDLSSVQVVTAYLDRIEQINPSLNAIVSLRPRNEIMADAERADATPRAGWLHGIPIAIKDLAETKGLRTTFGSPLFADHIPDEDALTVARIKAAGAIVIGKTNTPEFGLGSHSFNPVHGVTCNPYASDRTAGGSSGGAAAALAARLLPIADGSDMMGSLRNPAAFCNVYGFRPTWGLVPPVPKGDMFFARLSTHGPMARTPQDVAGLLATMSGSERLLPFAVIPDPDIADISGPVAGKRIGWLGDWGGAFSYEDGILDLCHAAVRSFETLGCTVEAVAPPFPATDIWHAWVTLRAWEIASNYAPLYGDPEKRALLKPAMIWEIEKGLALSGADVHAASQIRSDWYRAMIALSDQYDALAMPSAQVWPFPVDWIYPEAISGVPMDTYHRWMQVVTPVSLIGVPSLAVPAGFGKNSLPMGFQMFGAPGTDRALLTLGHAYHGQKDWTAEAPTFPC